MKKIEKIDMFGIAFGIACSIFCFWAATSFLLSAVLERFGKHGMVFIVLLIVRIVFLYVSSGFMCLMSVAIWKDDH